MKDNKLIQEINVVIDRYLTELKGPSPSFKPQDVAAELHGPLADMIYVDKVENEPLVSFIITLLYVRKNRTDEEILALLEDLSAALGEMTEAGDQPKA